MRRIACIGGATLDRKVVPIGSLRPATSNPVHSEVCAGGTARNVAEALARLGCPVELVSRLGEDAAGEAIVEELASLGVGLEGVERVAELPTASYTAVLDESGELALGLADMEILDSAPSDWIERALGVLERCELWIVDANLPDAVITDLAGRAPAGVRLYADPVSVEKSRRLISSLARVHTLFPDRHEGAELAGVARETPDAEIAAALRDRGPARVVLTLGADGVRVEEPARRERVAAMETSRRVDVTGAGDCLIAGFVYGEDATDDLDPVRAGLAAAALAIESARTVPLELDAELLRARCGKGS